MDIRSLCHAIQDGWEAVAALEQEECDSRPGPPAAPDDIERLLATHGEHLPPDYVEFLKLHDGWAQITFGHILFSIEQLLGEDQEQFEVLKRDIEDNTGQELGDVIGILWSENDAHIMYVDPTDGQIVEHCHEELGRYATFREYLEERLEQVHQWLADIQQTQGQLIRDLDPGFRARTEAAVEAWGLEALAAREPMRRAEVDLSVVPAYVRRERWREAPVFEDEDGYVCLGLSLYLAFAPTADEMRAALRAWRAWSRWDGPVQAGSYRAYVHPEPLEDPGDETAWAALLDTDPSDARYGLVWIETEGGDSETEARMFSIRVFSEARGEDGYAQASPLCLVTLPLGTDRGALPRLAAALLEVLPVRSGVGGVQARYSRYPTRCHDWCRQFPGLDLQDPDMVYPPLRQGVGGAGWITVVGPALARALEAGGPITTSDHVAVTRGDHGGLILQAGPAPDLRHITRGVPEGMAEVEALLRPLKIGSASSAPTTRAFKDFETTDPHYGPWLYRFEDPTRFLRHAAWELSQLADEIGKWGTPDDLVDLARLAAGTESDRSDGLARALYNAGCAASRRGMRDGARALYEACLDLPDCLPQTHGNLIVCYNELGQFEEACAFTEAHLWRRDPYVFVNGACAFCELGDTERALELLRQGFQLGFDRREAIRNDPCLARLHDDARFLALFE